MCTNGYTHGELAHPGRYKSFWGEDYQRRLPGSGRTKQSLYTGHIPTNIGGGYQTKLAF